LKRTNRMTTQHAKLPIVGWPAILCLGLLWLGSSLGCGSPGGSSSDQTPAADEQDAPGNSSTDGEPHETAAKFPGHVEIPHPDIFDEEVRQQLQRKRSALAALCELPGVNDAQLSQSYGEMGMLYHAYGLHDAAETGNYDQAMQWQKKAIAVATSANRADAMPRLKKNLALYESGKPCRTPW